MIVAHIPDDNSPHQARLRALLGKLNEAVQRADAAGWDGSGRLTILLLSPDEALEHEMIASQSETPIEIAPGIMVTWSVPMAKSIGFQPIIQFAAHFADEVVSGAAAGIVAAWFVSRFSGRAGKVSIQRREVTFEKNEIARIIEETITKE